MNGILLAGALVAGSSAFLGQAAAVTLSLEPSSQDIGVGGTASVDLVISGMGATGAPSLGAFLTDITFDPAILSFTGVDYGPFLGDPSDFFETDIVTTPGVGSVSLEEISFLFDFELDALQSASFPLATLSFSGSAVGVSNLVFGTVDLSDAEFPATTLTADLVGASINVTGGVTGMPEPSPLLLLFGGAAGLGAARRLREKNTVCDS